MNKPNPSSRPHLLLMGEYPSWDLDDLASKYTVLRLWEAADQDAFLAEHAPQIRAIATRGDLGASRAIIEKLPNLEIISCYGVGVDAIDLETSKARKIAVTNTPDVLTGDVADLAVGLTLAVCRRIPTGENHVREGHWPAGPMPLVNRVHGKKLGICGFGRIGKTVAHRFSGFDMEIGYFDIQKSPDSACRFFANLEELARWSEILIVTLAGGPSTHNLINKPVLEALGAEGFLVNVSRGTTVDEAALLTALKEKTIAGAGLDVFLNEPNINPEFMAMPNTVLQPHHASGTIETRKAMGQLVRDNLDAHFSSRPLLTQVV